MLTESWETFYSLPETGIEGGWQVENGVNSFQYAADTTQI